MCSNLGEPAVEKSPIPTLPIWYISPSIVGSESSPSAYVFSCLYQSLSLPYEADSANEA